MQFVLMFDVMLILPILGFFVLLRIVVRSREPGDHPGTWNLESQESCALDHSSLPNNVPINHCDLLRLI
jgi:hypothetical protein